MVKLVNRIVTVSRTPVFFGKEVFPAFDRLVKSMRPSGIFILVDSNTREKCLPVLMRKTAALATAQVMEVTGGEAAKSLACAEKLWNDLLQAGAGRSSLVINLGGGVISDLGGFVAAGYNRGIKYINIPTSLMGQADAAIGGKTAVNLGNIKNQVGFFHSAAAIFIFPEFLKTLPGEHLRSGFAEIIKSILVSDGSLWRRLQKRPVSLMMSQSVESATWQDLILAAITFKNKVVVKDYREVKLRKVLNFGHTFGHAFESAMMNSKGPILHGEAVAAGMICAAWLSHLKTGLSRADLDAITKYIDEGYSRVHVDPASFSMLMEIMMHDKKMKGGQLQFTLLSKPGLPVTGVLCSREEIREAIDFYNTTLSG
jgi:3-dehydroquinate synthase